MAVALKKLLNLDFTLPVQASSDFIRGYIFNIFNYRRHFSLLQSNKFFNLLIVSSHAFECVIVDLINCK